MTVDRELVTRKMLLIVRDLDALQSVAAAGAERYLESPREQAMTERYLERIIGRMIDVNYHVITESGGAPPADYHASFTRLAELQILDHAFAGRIARAAGLRNRLVHEYNEIDPRRVFEALQATLDDVPEYLRKVDDYVARVSAP
jgi:uncharacterized protein YutE (UPF0331/DUF86 family)